MQWSNIVWLWLIIILNTTVLCAQGYIDSNNIHINDDKMEMEKIAYANASQEGMTHGQRLLFPSTYVLQQIQSDVRSLKRGMPEFTNNISEMERELVGLKQYIKHYVKDSDECNSSLSSVKKNTLIISMSVNQVQRALDRIERILQTLIFNVTTNITGLYENVRGNYDEYQELSTNLSDVSQRINDAHSIWPSMLNYMNASDAKLQDINMGQDRVRNILLQQGHQILSELGKISQKIDMTVYEVNTESSRMHNELVNFILTVSNQVMDLRRIVEMQVIGIPGSPQNSLIGHPKNPSPKNVSFDSSSFHRPKINHRPISFSPYRNPLSFDKPAYVSAGLAGSGVIHKISGSKNITGTFGGSFVFFPNFEISNLLPGYPSLPTQPGGFPGFPNIPGFPGFPGFPDPASHLPPPYIPPHSSQGQSHPIYPSYPLYPPIIPNSSPGVSTDGFPGPSAGPIHGDQQGSYPGAFPPPPSGWNHEHPTSPSYPVWPETPPSFNGHPYPPQHGGIPPMQHPTDSYYPPPQPYPQPDGSYPTYPQPYPGGPHYPGTTPSHHLPGHDSYPGHYPEGPMPQTPPWPQTDEPILIPPGIPLGDGPYHGYCICICPCDCTCPIVPNNWVPDQHAPTPFQPPFAHDNYNPGNLGHHGRWPNYSRRELHNYAGRCHCLCPCACPSHMPGVHAPSYNDWTSHPLGGTPHDLFPGAPPNGMYPGQQHHVGYPGQQHHVGYPGEPHHVGYPGEPQHVGYPGEPHHGGYPGEPHNAGYPGEPHHVGYPGEPHHGGYPGEPHHVGYPGEPHHGGYPGDPNQIGYPGEPHHVGYPGEPHHGGYPGEPHHGGFPGDPNQIGYPGEPHHVGYPGEPHHGGFPGEPHHGGYPGEPHHGGFPGDPNQIGYPGEPHHVGYPGEPHHGGFPGEPHHGGYPGEPHHGGFPGDPNQIGYPGEPHHVGYPGEPHHGGFPGEPHHGGYPGEPHHGGFPGDPNQIGYPGEQHHIGYPGEPHPVGYPGEPHHDPYPPHGTYPNGGHHPGMGPNDQSNGPVLHELRAIRYDIGLVKDDVNTARAAIMGLINDRIDDVKYFLSDMHHANLAYHSDHRNVSEDIRNSVKSSFQDTFYMLNTITNYAMATSTDVEQLTQHMKYQQQQLPNMAHPYPNYHSANVQKNYSEFWHENETSVQTPKPVGGNKTKLVLRHEMDTESPITLPTTDYETKELSQNNSDSYQCKEEMPIIENELKSTVNGSEQPALNNTKKNSEKDDDDSSEEVDLPDIDKLLDDEDRFTAMALNKALRPFHHDYTFEKHHRASRPRKLKSKHHRHYRLRPHRKVHGLPFVNSMISRLVSNLHSPIPMYSQPIIPVMPNVNSLLAHLGLPPSIANTIPLQNSHYRLKPMIAYDMLHNMPDLHHVPNLPNLQNLPNFHNLPGLVNLPGLPNLPNLPGLPNLPNLQNLPNIQNIMNLPNFPKEILTAAHQGKPFSASYADGQGNQWNINVNRRFSSPDQDQVEGGDDDDDDNDDDDDDEDEDGGDDDDIIDATRTENVDSLQESNSD